MPIRFVSKASRRAVLRPSLQDFSAALSGTFVPAPARTGLLSPVLGNVTSAFVGSFQTVANRTGTVASTLGNATGNIQGNFIASGAPAQVTGLTAVQVGTTVVLDWNDLNPNGLFSYLIYKTTDVLNWGAPYLVNLGSPPVSAVTDTTGFVAGTTYFYHVSGTNGVQEGQPSATASVFYNGINAATDWTARIAGSFYAQNFNYANLNAAYSHATNPHCYGASVLVGGLPDPAVYEIRTDHALSGKSMRINYPANSDGQGRSWMETYDVNSGVQVHPSGAGEHNNFYHQIIIWTDVMVDWPFQSNAGSDLGTMASQKFMVIDSTPPPDNAVDSSNPGEVVLTNHMEQGFVESYIGFTSSGVGIPTSTIVTPKSPGGTRRMQNAVDTGSPANPVTDADFRARYGMLAQDFIALSAGQIAALTSTSRSSNYGIPYAPAHGPGVTWNKGGWTVVEQHIDYTQNLMEMWAAPYGSAPKLISSTALIGNPAWGRTHGYAGYQLTPFITGNTDAGGAQQPTVFFDTCEVIGSNNPIPFPGGFALSGTTTLENWLDNQTQGVWVQYPVTQDLTPITFTNAGGSLLGFCGRMVYDQGHKKIQMRGSSHSPTSDADNGLITFDLASNLWSRQGAYAIDNGNGAHGYDELTVHQPTGDLYIKLWSSTTVKRLPYGAPSATGWLTMPSAPFSQTGTGPGMEWFPEINGGAGGLVVVDQDYFRVSNSDFTWIQVSPYNVEHIVPSIASEIVVCRSGGYVYGGNGTSIFRLPANPTFTYPPGVPAERIADPPIPVQLSGGPSGGGMGTTFHPHPNGTDLLLIEQSDGGRRMWRYNAVGNNWVALGAILPDNSEGGLVRYGVAVTIPGHGMLLMLQHGNNTTPVVWTYRP